MKAYKLALPLLAATVLLTGGAGVAAAQETGPFTIACRDATDKLDKAVKADEEWEKAKDQNKAYREAREEVRKELQHRDFDGSAIENLSAAEITVQQVNDAKVEDTDKGQQQHYDKLATLVQKRINKYNKAHDDNEVRLERKAKEDDADKLRDEANKACGVETTTPAPAPTTTPPPPPAAALDCAGFATQADAQSVFDADPIGRANLDPGRNGKACDEAPDNGSSVDSVVTPSGGVATGGGPA